MIWASVVLHAGQQPDRGLINALVTTPKGELGRDDVLARLRGPSWRDRYGDAAFDDRYDEWCARRIEWRNGVGNAMLLDRGGHPPLDALVTAWEAGLTRVVTIPCVGSYIRANSVCSLLITEETRADPEAYSAALTWFAEQAGHAD